MFRHAFLTLGLVAVAPVYADDVRCTGSIGGTTVDGNVIVPKNRSCTLNGTYVKGNVEVRDDAKLLIRSGAKVNGNVQSDGAARVRIRDSEIGGDVQLTGIDFTEQSLIVNSQVGGTVDWFDNSAPFLLRFTEVDSDVKVNQNSARASVFDNVIGGNLQCQSNEPRPTGARNVVEGSREDQCKSF